ncbi:hypothetical protein TRSC58_05059 [Trypanosoma rangeli SC58]|uniref:N-acetyltransferase ESCO zinc-finger domain-containing protein n=1 Tax=Trypanosoma rangeli SC58 TaxID=429131 RepID=A0A061IZG0_TRYRA|nr:hypothetical protein TRSC58_05059 [Trypanosoma rangeli SC58]
MKRQRSLFDFFPKRRVTALAAVVAAAAPAAPEAENDEIDEPPPLASARSKIATPQAVSGACGRVAVSPTDAIESVDNSATNVFHTSLCCLDTPRRTQAAVQTFLDFGQNNAGGTMKCSLCGMVFNFTVTEDIRIHERCCTALFSGKSGASKKGKQRADGLEAWLASAQLGKALEGLLQPKRRGQAVRESLRKCTNGEFCTRVQESSHKELVLYVFDGSKQDCVKDVVFRRLVEALEFSEVMLCAAAYFLVAVVHCHTGRLLCAVAGKLSTREQDPVLILGKSECCTVTRCHTRSCVTFCDVPYVWCQRDAVLEATIADWWHPDTVAALQPTRVAIQDFFQCTKQQEKNQQRLHVLVDTALRCAVTTLGRHVSYGRTLCPRSEFSYDCNTLSSDVLGRVEVVTACINAEAPLYTHTDGHDAFGDSDAELSVVSYGE